LRCPGFDGPLAQEEADLLELRLTKERLAEEELERVRQELEVRRCLDAVAVALR
jgi:hypothetical protein